MIFEVEMVAFQNVPGGRDQGIRKVEVKKEYLTGELNNDLKAIFKWGQNDFQPKKFPSVSVGDVIRYKGGRYMVEAIGFRKLDKGEEGGLEKAYNIKLPQEGR